MKLQKCENRQEWNNWLNKQKSAEFLQSWEWGEFQKRAGAKPLRLQIEENGNIFWQGQGFEYKVFGLVKFVYFPKVSFAGLTAGHTVSLFSYLKNKKYIFARIEAVDELNDLKEYKTTKVNNRQPKNTFVLDIAKDEEQIKEGMHSKTRYNIGLAERKGIIIKQEKNIDAFWQLNVETKERDKFKSRDKDYYKKMLDIDFCYQLTAYKGDEPVASNICINFGGVFTYLHGASSNKYRNLMAPYLLQWECIRFAKKLGAQKYDFGGTAQVCLEEDVKSKDIKTPTCFNSFCWETVHKWTGITRFKVGFGGEPKDYPDAQEVVLNSSLYKLFNKVKKLI